MIIIEGYFRLSQNLIQVWFSSAREQLAGVNDACLYVIDREKKSLVLLDTTNKVFGQSKQLIKNTQAVMQRRKSIVTINSHAQEHTDIANQAVMNQAVANQAQPLNVTSIKSKNYLVTTPLIVNKQIVGVVSFEFAHDNNLPAQDYLGKVEATANWLDCLSQLLPAITANTDAENAEFALKITAMALSQSTSSEAEMAVVAELANGLQCERVSIGFMKNQHVHLQTMSNNMHEGARQNVAKSIEAAMLEAIEQQETIVYPPASNSYYAIQEHDALIRQHAGEYICTVPLVVDEAVIGAVMFERKGEAGEFTDQTKELCEQLAALFSPTLHYRRLNDRPITEKIKASSGGFLSAAFGSGCLGGKLISMFLLCLFIFTFFVQWDYKVSANAVLEGAVERVITSPEGGYIKDASARPGDIVEAGVTLATLDDRDLQLEKLKWAGNKKKIEKEYREALALHDLSQIGILRAQLSQAEAQLEILEHKLNRTVITSPITAIIVSGDYTRALGSPVERGQVLYKVSPLENYHVILQVDEADITELEIGMTGELTLSAAAEERFEIEVVKVTPVSTAENGINYFQVEAKLRTTPEFLRPGMQGVGKIEIGERQLFWIGTHKMVDWIRLKLWSWW